MIASLKGCDCGCWCLLLPGEEHQLCEQQGSAASLWKSHQWWVPRGPEDGVVLSKGSPLWREGKGKRIPSGWVAVDMTELRVHVIMGGSRIILRVKDNELLLR